MADLKVDIAGVRLRNPIIGASGTFGYGAEYSRFFDLNQIGGFVSKGISLLPKTGNPPPRVAETSSGMLNAIGLENVGLQTFIDEKLPAARKLNTRLIVNIFGNTVEEYAEVAHQLGLQEGIDALELNISCPNIKAGGILFGTSPENAGLVTREVRQATDKPLWVKLSPNITDIVTIAEAVVKAGADAVSLINTLTGMAVDLQSRKPILANITGGLSGPAIKPVGLRMVWQVASAVDVPVIGIGGIVSAQDAAEYLLVGASAVQIGTANFIDPAATAHISEDLSLLLDDLGCEKVEDLRGKLKLP
jgi:dihydroorotate dehydrogenase (NAD+) catalytic subunit